jgi:succinylarginine dihydrolase
MAYEVNFDGIVGPTHNYSGLSFGNLASTQHKALTSHPKQAALQGLKKMKFLADLGLKQGVLPPQERPSLAAFRQLGFQGSLDKILKNLSPEILYACSSASSMWAANAATFATSIDTLDHRCHFIAANLSGTFHRSLETETTRATLQEIFNSPLFTHHTPLPTGAVFSDEGAANHTRFCPDYGKPGIHLFVYGRQGFNQSPSSTKFPARQTLEASQAIVRKLNLPEEKVIFAQQNPLAVDAGVFHNDVISVGNQNLFFYHEQAFVDTEKVIDQLRTKALKESEMMMIPLQVTKDQLSLKEAVDSYLFNSQLITLPDRSMLLLAPDECQKLADAKIVIDQIIQSKENPIQAVHYFDLRESMWNGGGPACLRLRLVLTQSELNEINQNVLLTDELYNQLVLWVERPCRPLIV